MKERLERVVSEAQLRPGLLVEVRACWCNGGAGVHRVLLIRRELADGCARCTDVCPSWHEAPVLHNDPRPSCMAEKIREGTLYIVNPFDEQEDTTRVSRPRELAR